MVERTGLENRGPQGPQGSNVARIAALRAGLPVSVAAVTVNRFCSSGLQAIAMAAHQILNEGADAAIGGGVESISMTERCGNPHPWVTEHSPGIYMVMGVTAEVVAKRYNISRQVQDEYSLLSQQRTARAQQEGFFEGEIAPMRVTRALLDKGPRGAAKKFGEEAVEFVIAAVSQSEEALRAEAADVLYHFLVVLKAREVSLGEVLGELERRTARSGHEEKASRAS